MDRLSISSGGSVDATALIVGAYSDGNDPRILKGEVDIASVAGRSVHLVELSASHDLLAPARDSVSLSEAVLGGDINTYNADMIAAYATTDVEAVVSWNPLVSAIMEELGTNKHFDSSDIPDEIIGLIIVNIVTLAANSNIGKVLTDPSHEMMGLMAAGGEAVLADKAKAFVTDLASCKVLPASTEMFFGPAYAVLFT